MIHIDQVRTLEIKVKQAVQLVVHLRRENDHLRSRLADTEVRIQEMEELLGALKTAQTQIELGIQSALNDLGQIDSEPRQEIASGDVAVVESLIQPPVKTAEPVIQASAEATLAFDDSFEESSNFEDVEPDQTLELELPTSDNHAHEELSSREHEQPSLGIF